MAAKNIQELPWVAVKTLQSCYHAGCGSYSCVAAINWSMGRGYRVNRKAIFDSESVMESTF